MKKRSEIQNSDKWNVEALYPNREAWEKDFASFPESERSPKWPSLTAFQGRLGENATTVKQLFDLSCTLARHLEKLYTYAHLRHDEEITNDPNKSAYQRISSLSYDFQQEVSWIEPELLALPDQTIEEYLQTEELESYRFHIEKIVRMKPHTLSADKEALLAMAGKPLQTPPQVFSALNNADIQFGTIEDGEGQQVELSHGLYQLYLRSEDRQLRENAFKGMHGKFKEMQNTMAELIYGQVQAHLFNAKARSYKSCLEAALFSKKIPTSVYKSLISTVRKNLPKLHRYVSVRKKILGVDQIHLYDMYVPMVRDVDIAMDYEPAEKAVIESVVPLGSEYQNALRTGLEEQRWVDRFENANKRSGAYSSGCFDSYPYILMNYRGILRDTFTLAHEAGHSMHSHLSHTNQPYHYSHYPIFVAEVASTFNEDLLMDLMLKERSDPEEKLFLLGEKLEDIRATLFRQAMFAEFELAIHEFVEAGQPLTPALLSETYYKLNQDYFGPDAIIDEEIAIEWARIPHFYYNFYVYQYATGISAALYLSKKVMAGDSHARDNYMNFLKGGCSLFPIDLLKLAGVDMTSPAPVQSAIDTFDSLLTEFENLALSRE